MIRQCCLVWLQGFWFTRNSNKTWVTESDYNHLTINIQQTTVPTSTTRFANSYIHWNFKTINNMTFPSPCKVHYSMTGHCHRAAAPCPPPTVQRQLLHFSRRRNLNGPTSADRNVILLVQTCKWTLVCKLPTKWICLWSMSINTNSVPDPVLAHQNSSHTYQHFTIFMVLSFSQGPRVALISTFCSPQQDMRPQI